MMETFILTPQHQTIDETPGLHGLQAHIILHQDIPVELIHNEDSRLVLGEYGEVLLVKHLEVVDEGLAPEYA